MRLLIVSNRAPVNISHNGKEYVYSESSGGLASGLRAYVEKLKVTAPDTEILWLGWPGATIPAEDQKSVKAAIHEFGCESIFLSEEAMQNFYEGFCNKTIWPLFHYFPVYTRYHQHYWEDYADVNRIFANEILKIYQPGDVIWIHDYHLMLLPSMIRELLPKATIGFFLHIPFPAYEIFRMMPSEWRKEILEGLLGADLIGFHTHDYRTYFLRSVMRILGLSHHSGEIVYQNRPVKVDSFPMGIDFEKYHSALFHEEVKIEKKKFRSALKNQRIILSIDRQDYSKGILNRLRGFESFLKKHPEAKEKISMVLIVIPSRIGVENYMEIKSQIDQLISEINGAFGTIEWTPINYQYRSQSFAQLIALYSISDIALITPFRDGMNLIAKEYIACRKRNGVLILSEMAGAAEELSEAIIINPNNTNEIADSIYTALEMKESDQTTRIATMQKRIKEYDIFKWAKSFLETLDKQKVKQHKLEARMLTQKAFSKIIKKFTHAEQKLLFFDYDGTLKPFAATPAAAKPDESLLALIHELALVPDTELVLISGRDWETMNEWFGNLPLNLVAEHGLFTKEINAEWQMMRPVRRHWKPAAMQIMRQYAEKLPGALIEEKDYSLAFHFRRSDQSLAHLRVRELVNQLVSFSTNMELKLQRGHKVIELRPAGVDKGIAALKWLQKQVSKNHFILAAGDDLTDEDLFRVMPSDAISIKVGRGASYAVYNVENSNQILKLIRNFIKSAKKTELMDGNNFFL